MLFTPLGNLGFCGGEGGGGGGTGNSPYFFSAAGNGGISGAPGFGGDGGTGTVSVLWFQLADINGNCLFLPTPRNASNIIVRTGNNNSSFSNWAFALCFLFIMATRFFRDEKLN